MQTIFISYRHSDSEGQAGRLRDALGHHFGKKSVFMDVATLAIGQDFRKVIDMRVRTCGVLLAVIGKDWLDASEAGRRRLDDADDFVRCEIASALDHHIPVIPVLVREARMPRADELPDDVNELAYREGVELTHSQWDSGLQLLVKALRPLVEEPKNVTGSSGRRRKCLAGDIGGTHTRIALFEETASKLTMVLERVYPSREHKGLDEILSLFMSNQDAHIDLACFGVAGPVLHDRVSTPNLPWVVEALKLAQQIGVAQVFLINDLMAHAFGVDDLGADELVLLNKVDRSVGNAALIAAGTGLGEAGMYWDGSRRWRWPFPCEGGHTDFAPRNDVEIALLQYLLKKFGRVSYERVLSGPGLKNIYEFLRDTGIEHEPAWLKDELAGSADPVALISEHGLHGKAAICQRVLDIFVSVYGAEAGNLALKLMATGGVYISGGIAAKILPQLTNGAFLQAFVTKGRLQPVLETIPVKVIVNDKVGLIGAARYAIRHAGKRRR